MSSYTSRLPAWSAHWGHDDTNGYFAQLVRNTDGAAVDIPDGHEKIGTPDDLAEEISAATGTTMPTTRAALVLACPTLKFASSRPEHLWTMNHVNSINGKGQDMGYTTGLTHHRLPELVITGRPPVPPDYLLSRAAQQHLATPLTPERVYNTISGALPIKVITASVARIPDLTRAFPPPTWSPTVLQLLWPDKNGHYPDDPDWTDPPSRQPVLGPALLSRR